MSNQLAVAPRAYGTPVRRTTHLAHILFPHVNAADLLATLDVHPDSSPRCRNHGADDYVYEAGGTETAYLRN